MAGCSTLPKPCDPAEPDPPKPEEQANGDVVRQFIEQVWNTPWTPADDKEFLAQRAAGNYAFVPKSIAAALDALRSDNTVRHRRDADQKPVKSSGKDDYAKCVNAVHEVAQDIRITVIDLLPVGDRVTAVLQVRGIDRRVDGRTDLAGAFGRTPPSGQPFRLQTATVYHVANGKIKADYLLYGGMPAYA
jgi:ketosteroid isomerase-like protein